MDAEKLEFVNDAFDIICGSGISHHLNLDIAYSEIKKNSKDTRCSCIHRDTWA